MISYHPKARPASMSKGEAARRLYTHGYRVAETDDPERIAAGISRCAWAPSVFRDGYRCKANWLSANWVGLDFDSGEMTLGDALNSFCDMVHIIGTTESHQVAKNGSPPRDRFRVLLRLECTVEDRELYEHQLKLIHKKYPVDDACLEAARFFFRCQEIQSVNPDGLELEVVDITEAERNRLRRPLELHQARAQSGMMPPWADSILSRPWRIGEKNNLCFRLGAALGVCGYSVNDIIHLIHNSVEYSSCNMSQELMKEIETAVTNGVKRGINDLEEIAG